MSGHELRAEAPRHAHDAVGGRLALPGVGGLHQVHVIGTFAAELNASPGTMPGAQNSRAVSSGTVARARSRAASQRARVAARRTSVPRGSTTAEGLHAAATSSSSAHTPRAMPAR